ncbi:MAG TPA: low-specificity L-threonine aldolase [Anaerolineales bacterium]|nr:low-specificity L-threonine aldolase [Anaerolineales bacterium]
MQWIDFRSDTVSHPTPAMREAMFRAEVGDDVFGDDPTVLRLQARAAEMLGKEAALFVPSGTMANLTALLAHTRRGDEVICGYNSHIFRNEQANLAVVGGLLARPLHEQADGTLDLAEMADALNVDDPHLARTALVAIENTHNMRGAVPLSLAYTQAVGEFARQNSLGLHIDGARIFNAALALGLPVSELVAPADTVSFCLSKGLCAPIGSLLVGQKDLISKAFRARKMLGGAMRQVGVAAAAGLVALDTMVARLVEDHAHAARLAEGLAQVAGVQILPTTHRTNMVYFDLTADYPLSPSALAQKLQAHGILLSPMYGNHFRAVTHYWITAEHIEQVLRLIGELP